MIKHLLMAMLAFNFLYESKAVEFSVETIDDKLGLYSVLSSDGEIYTMKEGKHVWIHHWDSRKLLGVICCHIDEQHSKEFFIDDAGGEKTFFRTKLIETKEKKATLMELYQLNGKKIREIKFKGETPFKLLSVSRKKKHIGIYDGSNVVIYNNNLDEVSRYPLDKKMIEPKLLKIANGGVSFILGGKSGLLYGDIIHSNSNYIKDCLQMSDRIVKGRDIYFNSFEENTNKYFLLSGKYSCLLEDGKGEAFANESAPGVIGVYADSNYLYAVSSLSLSVISSTSKRLLGQFDVKPYYKKNISNSPYERPFFVSHEYDYLSKTFFLGGSGTIGTLFKLKVSSSQPKANKLIMTLQKNR